MNKCTINKGSFKAIPAIAPPALSANDLRVRKAPAAVRHTGPAACFYGPATFTFGE
jgi:hypothetical protein